MKRIRHLRNLRVGRVPKVLVLVALFQAPLAKSQVLTYGEKLQQLRANLYLQINTCEAYQISEEGYLQYTHSRQYIPVWSMKTIINTLIPSFAKRRKIDLRSSLPLIASHSSSAQSAKALLKMAIEMDKLNFNAIRRSEVLSIMKSIYLEKKTKEKIKTCLNVKWGNFYPDLHAYPLYEETFLTIEKLFSSSIEVTEEEMRRGDKIGFSKEEIAELKKIGFATTLLENQIQLLKNDVGGWDGNPIAIYGNGSQGEYVCTDEMATTMIFLEYLSKNGMIKKFRTMDGKFSHRRPRAFADHFSIMLFNKDNVIAILDPWQRDGGKFPLISSIDSWYLKKEQEQAIFQSKSSYQEAFKPELELRIAPDDREVPKKDHLSQREDEEGSNHQFNLEGLQNLKRKY